MMLHKYNFKGSLRTPKTSEREKERAEWRVRMWKPSTSSQRTMTSWTRTAPSTSTMLPRGLLSPSSSLPSQVVPPLHLLPPPRRPRAAASGKILTPTGTPDLRPVTSIHWTPTAVLVPSDVSSLFLLFVDLMHYRIAHLGN